MQNFNNEKLCIASYLNTYFERTNSIREIFSKILISFAKPHKDISVNTLGRWIREVMHLAGINTNIFKPHSSRSATTSKAAERNVSLTTICASIGWRKTSTFGKHYKKPIMVNDGEISLIRDPGTS